MFKKLLVITALSAMASAQAQSAGDIAFTSFNADEDGWSLVALNALAANTSVFFTDNEVSGASFNTGESYFSWNTGANAIAAGTVVRFSAIDAAGRAASIGTFSQVSVTDSANTGLAAGADTLYAYLGTSATAPTTFLAAITNAGNFTTAAGGTLTGTGLTAGLNAIALTASADFGEYSGPRNNLTTFAAYASQVNNAANWSINVDGDGASFTPNTTSFSVTSPVPEPESLALMLAGLAVVGGVARRRARRD